MTMNVVTPSSDAAGGLTEFDLGYYGWPVVRAACFGGMAAFGAQIVYPLPVCGKPARGGASGGQPFRVEGGVRGAWWIGIAAGIAAELAVCVRTKRHREASGCAGAAFWINFSARVGRLRVLDHCRGAVRELDQHEWS